MLSSSVSFEKLGRAHQHATGLLAYSTRTVPSITNMTRRAHEDVQPGPRNTVAKSSAGIAEKRSRIYVSPYYEYDAQGTRGRTAWTPKYGRQELGDRRKTVADPRIPKLYRLACRSGHMVGLGSFLSSFCQNRVGKIAVKRKFQAPNLELFKTFIGRRLKYLRNRAIQSRIYHELIREFDLN